MWLSPYQFESIKYIPLRADAANLSATLNMGQGVLIQSEPLFLR
jgi:hypothetical protein